MTSLDDDYYVFDERHLTLIGERTKKMYKLGEEVKILVSKVDLTSHEIYFEIIEDEEEKEDNEEKKEEYSVSELDELIKEDQTKEEDYVVE